MRSIAIDGLDLPSDTPVWIWSEDEAGVEVEWRERRLRVPPNAVVSSPVRRPTLDELRRLDACFGMAADAFTTEHQDDARMFAILRCKAHQRRFLDDVRGGVFQYGRLTLLEATDESPPEEIWSRHHAMSDDWLNLLGRTL